MINITAAHRQPRADIHNRRGLQQSSVKQPLWLGIVSSLYNDGEDIINVKLRPIRSWKCSPDCSHHWGVQGEHPWSLVVSTGLLPSHIPLSPVVDLQQRLCLLTFTLHQTHRERMVYEPAIYNSSMICSPTQPQYKVTWVTLTWNLLIRFKKKKKRNSWE